MTLAEACARGGVTLAALRRARKGPRPVIARGDLLLAALTTNGARAEGKLDDPATLASWLDHVNHDGTTAEEVLRDLEALVREGRLVLAEGRFRLAARWP